MNSPLRKRFVFALVSILFLVRYDLWLWDDRSLVLGLPVGLLYHVGFCLAASAAFVLLVRWAWPRFDEPDSEGDR